MLKFIRNFFRRENAPGVHQMWDTEIQGIRISTINFDKMPYLDYEYETMVFGFPGDDDYRTRCSGFFNAKQQHLEACRWVRRELKKELDKHDKV